MLIYKFPTKQSKYRKNFVKDTLIRIISENKIRFKVELVDSSSSSHKGTGFSPP